MKSIYVKIVFDRKKTASREKEGAIEIRLSQNRRALYYNTGIRLFPRHWHDGQVVGRPDAHQVQLLLDTIMQRVWQTMAAMMEEGNCSIDALLARLRQQEDGELSFLEFAMQRTDVRCYGKSRDSRERYERFIKFLFSWGRIERFADITDAVILEMDALLAARKMMVSSRWFNYHRILNSFILDAIDAGYMTRNPYRWLHIEKGKSGGGLGKYLTPEEFQRIEQLDIRIPHLARVRDLFVFQTYTCLSYTDLAAFDAGKIKHVNGYPVYTGKRGKTGKRFTFLVLRPAMAILERYGNRLPIISNVKYNEYLKVLALMGGIDKSISSHWARHTGATMLLNEGMDMEIVAKVLGHSSTRITRQVYAKLLDETVVDAMSKMNDMEKEENK
ncbi:MAG: tyrosine-type recombinase/integrase [Prevotella sp.]|nr:tyrosine-type recombinase/integrase [Prevotella sp.]